MNLLDFAARARRLLAREGRDLLELVLLPGLALVLPWKLCFALFRRVAGWDFLYREACERALHEAMAMGWVLDVKAWSRERRLVTLVDHADFYLSRFRSDRWLRRHVCVEGQWPEPGTAFVGCTFHWGAGMWGLRHARAAGLSAHMLVAAFRPEHYVGRRVCRWYAQRRLAELGRALGNRPLDVSASLRSVFKALGESEAVLAVIDVPADQVAASETIAFMGACARVPRGLLRVAAERRLPVAVYLTGMRMSDGKRTLHIHILQPEADLNALMVTVFSFLEAAIRADPAAWHFWNIADRFFIRPAGREGVPRA